jgi:cytochrome oxidase Cu insertion factor (SCO1/SenC/PrrC family)
MHLGWTRKALVIVLAGALLLAVGTLVGPAAAAGPNVGDKAPDFTLPATTGEPISLSQFRGKRVVLLEFYGADFSPV